MKKFIIAMLCVAVLFGFASCDNSSNSPADDQTSTGVSDLVISKLAKDTSTDINTVLDSTSGVFVASKLTVTDGKLADGYALGDGYKTLSYTKTEEAEGQKPETGYTITLKGYASKSSNTTTVTLQEYEYKFTEADFGADGNYVTVSGTVSGYLTGTMTVTTTGSGETLKLSGVTVADAKAIIPNDASNVSITYAEEPVSAADFVAYANGTGAATGSAIETYASWRETALTTARGEIEKVVKTLLGVGVTDGTKLVASFADGKFTDGANVPSGSYDAASKTATITWTNGTDGKATVVATDAKTATYSIYLMPGQSMTLAIKGELTGTTLAAASYTLSGDFNVYAKYAEDNAAGTEAYSKFASIKVTEIAGDMTGDVTVEAGTNKVTEIDSAAAFEAPTAGVASASMEVGPAFDADGTYTAETVEKTFTATV